ncbi:MAG: branched-chain amino acid ABC transporter substrate-binding protein [Pseudomonadota bacterium]
MPARGEILIATAGPMSGPYLTFGDQYLRGAELAVEDLNARGGLLGQKVRLVVGDDACDAEQAVALARKLAGEGAVLVVGHYCSGASIPASKVYEEQGILMISPGSTNPRLTDEGGDNVFRVCGRDDAQGAIAGAYLAERWGGKRIAILHDQTAYGEGLASETRKELDRLGVSPIIYAPYEPGLRDYSPVADKLAAAQIDVVYIGGYSTEAALILRQAHDMGFPVRLVSGDAIITDDFWTIAGAAGEGTRMTYFPDARKTPQAAETVAAFRAQGYEPEGNTLYAYAAVQTWAQAVARAGSLELDQVIAALRSATFDTVLGDVAFDRKGDVIATSFIWYSWKSGRYEEVQ